MSKLLCENFLDSARTFDKSKLLRVRLHPLTPIFNATDTKHNHMSDVKVRIGFNIQAS